MVTIATAGYCRFLIQLFCSLCCAVAINASAVSHEFELQLDAVQIRVVTKNISVDDEAKLQQVLRNELVVIGTKTDEIFSSTPQKDSAASAEVTELYRYCDLWFVQSQRTFSCRLGEIEAQWQGARQRNELPERADLRQLASQLRSDKPPAITPGSYWHAWILDRLMARAQILLSTDEKSIRETAEKFIKLESLSQQRCWGKDASRTNSGNVVAQGVINDCYQVSSGFAASELAQLVVMPNAMSVIDQTLSDAQQKIAHLRLSNVINPRDGWPVEHRYSVMVTAADAMTANAVARSLAVKPAAAGVAWAESLAGVAALVLDEKGRVFATRNWYAQVHTGSNKPLWTVKKPFVIEYEIASQSTAEYRRPYLAIWISDEQAAPIKHLTLLGDNSRWLRELSLWWRKQGRMDDSWIDSIAGATKKPDRYRIVWNGRNDLGVPLSSGNYQLNIEVAREHGGHEVLQLPFTLSSQGFELSDKGRQELGKVNLRFTPH
jgi:thiamine biosynthesis lipoprotein